MEGEEALEEATALLKRLDLGLTNLCLKEGMSEEGFAAVQKEDGALPALHFYDRKGRLRYHLEGIMDHERIERHIEELLSE